MKAYFTIYSDYLGGGETFTKAELLDIIEYYLTTEDLSGNLHAIGPKSGEMIGSILASAGVDFDCGPCDASMGGVRCCIYHIGEVPVVYECVGTEVMGVKAYSWKWLWQCTFGCCGTRCCGDPNNPTTTSRGGTTTTVSTTSTTIADNCQNNTHCILKYGPCYICPVRGGNCILGPSNCINDSNCVDYYGSGWVCRSPQKCCYPSTTTTTVTSSTSSSTTSSTSTSSSSTSSTSTTLPQTMSCSTDRDCILKIAPCWVCNTTTKNCVEGPKNNCANDQNCINKFGSGWLCKAPDNCCAPSTTTTTTSSSTSSSSSSSSSSSTTSTEPPTVTTSPPSPTPTSPPSPTPTSPPVTPTSIPNPSGKCKYVSCGDGKCQSYIGGGVTEDESDPTDPCCCGDNVQGGGDCKGVQCVSGPSPSSVKCNYCGISSWSWSSSYQCDSQKAPYQCMVDTSTNQHYLCTGPNTWSEVGQGGFWSQGLTKQNYCQICGAWDTYYCNTPLQCDAACGTSGMCTYKAGTCPNGWTASSDSSAIYACTMALKNPFAGCCCPSQATAQCTDSDNGFDISTAGTCTPAPNYGTGGSDSCTSEQDPSDSSKKIGKYVEWCCSASPDNGDSDPSKCVKSGQTGQYCKAIQGSCGADCASDGKSCAGGSSGGLNAEIVPLQDMEGEGCSYEGNTKYGASVKACRLYDFDVETWKEVIDPRTGSKKDTPSPSTVTATIEGTPKFTDTEQMKDTGGDKDAVHASTQGTGGSGYFSFRVPEVTDKDTTYTVKVNAKSKTPPGEANLEQKLTVKVRKIKIKEINVYTVKADTVFNDDSSGGNVKGWLFAEKYDTGKSVYPCDLLRFEAKIQEDEFRCWDEARDLDGTILTFTVECNKKGGDESTKKKAEIKCQINAGDANHKDLPDNSGDKADWTASCLAPDEKSGTSYTTGYWPVPGDLVSAVSDVCKVKVKAENPCFSKDNTGLTDGININIAPMTFTINTRDGKDTVVEDSELKPYSKMKVCIMRKDQPINAKTDTLKFTVDPLNTGSSNKDTERKSSDGKCYDGFTVGTPNTNDIVLNSGESKDVTLKAKWSIEVKKGEEKEEIKCPPEPDKWTVEKKAKLKMNG